MATTVIRQATALPLDSPSRRAADVAPAPRRDSPAPAPAAGFVAQVLAREMLLDLRPDPAAPDTMIAYARPPLDAPARLDLVV